MRGISAVTSRWLAGLLALTLCSPVFAARKLTFCFENRPVIPWRTMELDGLNFELLKRIEPKLDLYFQYQPLPWKRCLSKLQANEVDGAFTVSFSEDRRAFGVYPGHAAPGHAVPDAQKRMHTARYFLMRKGQSHRLGRHALSPRRWQDRFSTRLFGGRHAARPARAGR